jgi:hypothetical protein
MMKTKVEFTWDNDDPINYGKQIDEAFNRVISFCPELLSEEEKSRRPAELISFNRVTNGEFDMGDIRRLYSYALQANENITERYAAQSGPQAESVLQAGRNVVQIMADVATYVTMSRMVQVL